MCAQFSSSLIRKKLRQRLSTDPSLSQSPLSLYSLPQISLPNINNRSSKKQQPKQDKILNQFVFNYFKKKSKYVGTQRDIPLIENRQRFSAKTPSSIKNFCRTKKKRNIELNQNQNPNTIDSYFNINNLHKIPSTQSKQITF